MKTFVKPEILQFGKTYHIFNKANGNDKLFLNNSEYYSFLKKLQHYILPWAEILSYCLVPNHFHILLSIKDADKIQLKHRKKEPNIQDLSKALSNFINSYSKSFNKTYNRKEKLFLSPFSRKAVNDDSYLSYLICYIHRNPIHHGLVNNYDEWGFSSYKAVLSDKPTHINRDYVLSWFESKEKFISFHQENKTKKGLKEYLFE